MVEDEERYSFPVTGVWVIFRDISFPFTSFSLSWCTNFLSFVESLIISKFTPLANFLSVAGTIGRPDLVRTPSMTRNWVATRFNLPTTLMPVSDFFAVLMIGSESCSTFNCSKKCLSVSNSGFGSFEFRPLFTTYVSFESR